MQAHRIAVQAAKPAVSPQPREPIPAGLGSQSLATISLATYHESGNTMPDQGVAFGRLRELWTRANNAWALRREAVLAKVFQTEQA